MELKGAILAESNNHEQDFLAYSNINKNKHRNDSVKIQTQSKAGEENNFTFNNANNQTIISEMLLQDHPMQQDR